MENIEPGNQDLFAARGTSLGSSRPDVRRFQEILQQQTTPFSLQIPLRQKEAVAGQVAKHPGFNMIYSDPSIEEYLGTYKKYGASLVLVFGPGCLSSFVYKEALGKAREGLPQTWGHVDDQSMAAALVRLPAGGGPAETLLALEYHNQRPDEFGRLSTCTIMLFLPASLAHEALKALSASPREALGIILDKIDSNLRQIAPMSGSISHFNSIETTFVPFVPQEEHRKRWWPFGRKR